MSPVIHETAIVSSKAEIADDVNIGPYCIVEDKVILGPGTRLEPYVQIKDYTRMGANNHIHSHAVIGGEPQFLGFKGEETWVEIGDRNIIREFVTIHRGTVKGGGRSAIGSECMLMAYVHIAHDCILGDGVIMANAASLSGHIIVGDKAILSGMSGVQQFVRIGEYAFLGAMGGFTKDVPPYMLATGVRGGLVGLNLIGLKRNGFSSEAISALKKAYRGIWRSGMRWEEALDHVQESLGESKEVARLIEFLRATEIGVLPTYDSKKSNN